MALLKDIKLNNGIVLSYHRINTVLIHTNEQIVIEVSSYINEEERLKEKEWYEQNADNDIPMNVYIETEYYNIDYNEEFSVKQAYEYLKTLDKYKGSIDV